MKMKNLGNLLKDMRLERGISLREFSSDLGISHAYLNKLEKGIDPRTGKPVIPSIETLTKIAEGLSIPAKEFLELCGYFDEESEESNEDIDKLSMITETPLSAVDLRAAVNLFLSELQEAGPLTCDGEPVSPESLRLFCHSVEVGLALAMKNNPN